MEYVLFIFSFTNVVIWFISYFLLPLLHMRAMAAAIATAAVLFFSLVPFEWCQEVSLRLFYLVSFGNGTYTYHAMLHE